MNHFLTLQNGLLPSPSTSCLVPRVKYISFNLINSLNSYDLPDYQQHYMNPTIHLIQSYNVSVITEKFHWNDWTLCLPRQSTNNTMQSRISTNKNYGPHILIFNWGQNAYPVLQKNIKICYNLFRKIVLYYSIYITIPLIIYCQCWQTFLLDYRFQFKSPT